MYQNRSQVREDAADAREFAQIAPEPGGDAIIGTNLAGQVAYLNRAAESMTGWSREAALDRPLDEVCCIVDGTDRTAALNPLASAIRDDKATTLTENCVLIRRDGFESIIEDSVEPIHDGKGHVAGAVMVFRDVSNARAVERLDTESALRKALTQDEFLLHYQSKVRLDTGELSGVEALIRWNRPGYGLIPPLDFVPMLEETGLIVPVGAWVIHSVCRQIAEWQRTGVGAVRIAINLSSRQFSSADRQSLELETETTRAVHAHGIDPTLLEFELTESVLMSHAEKSVAILHRLKRLGIRISTDDFGTGFSSLAYLKRFPIDTIKIDRLFIRDVTRDASDAAITVAIIAMAHSLKLNVIAEGVETREQLEFLRARDCDEVQGYYLSRPLPATEVSQLLCRGSALPARAY